MAEHTVAVQAFKFKLRVGVTYVRRPSAGSGLAVRSPSPCSPFPSHRRTSIYTPSFIPSFPVKFWLCVHACVLDHILRLRYNATTVLSFPYCLFTFAFFSAISHCCTSTFVNVASALFPSLFVPGAPTPGLRFGTLVLASDSDRKYPQRAVSPPPFSPSAVLLVGRPKSKSPELNSSNSFSLHVSVQRPHSHPHSSVFGSLLQPASSRPISGSTDARLSPLNTVVPFPMFSLILTWSRR